ncbi:hypothetical protein MMC14_003377 [Varicellaria rhodocarpa]|nr:hypothetical protein [Varicellaria rhodocarpa]
MRLKGSPTLLLSSTVFISCAIAVDFAMMSVRGTRAGTGEPVYTRCTNVAESTCCHSLFPYDMAAFDRLPENAAATYWSWTSSPNLPSDNNAKCDQKLLKCDASFPLSWYTAPAPRSSAETSLIITGGKWLAYRNRDGKGILAGIEATTLSAISEITSMCKNLLSRDNQMVSRRGRRTTSATSNKSSKWVYPDIIMYNGTEYNDFRRNDKVYKDSMGNVFDLNLLTT